MTRRLSEAKVRAIQRAADAGTLTLRELAAEFGVSVSAVVGVVNELARNQSATLDTQHSQAPNTTATGPRLILGLGSVDAPWRCTTRRR